MQLGIAAEVALVISAPPSDQRSDFVPAVGGDFVLPGGQDFVREADFVSQYSKHYLTSKHWEAESSIFCENRES